MPWYIVDLAVATYNALRIVQMENPIIAVIDGGAGPAAAIQPRSNDGDKYGQEDQARQQEVIR